MESKHIRRSPKEEIMYKIEAIIRPHRLEAVREALEELGLTAITVSECRGAGSQKAPLHSFRGSQYSAGLEIRSRLELFVLQEDLDSAVDAIQAAANTGEVGDGKILVFKAEQAVRIRTNERGDAALS
jgi:nitrogen regulatory protein P-II 1